MPGETLSQRLAPESSYILSLKPSMEESSEAAHCISTLLLDQNAMLDGPLPSLSSF